MSDEEERGQSESEIQSEYEERKDEKEEEPKNEKGNDIDNEDDIINDAIKRITKKVEDDPSKGVTIPMKYKKRKSCPCCIEEGEEDEKGRVRKNDTSRIRYFSDDLPEELADHGVSQKEFSKIIKKVNRIWVPCQRRFAM